MSIIFGYDPSENEVVPYAFNGQPGWWAVPPARNWYSRTLPDTSMEVSPNANFIPAYRAILNLDGTLVFQDLLRSKMSGLLGPQ